MKRFYLRLSWICKEKEQRLAKDNETVKKVAFLSRLRIEDDKIEATEQEFNKILNWIEQLNEVNTDDVEPLVSGNESNIVCREDKVTEGNQSAAVLANAPQAEYGYFVVPKVVE